MKRLLAAGLLLVAHIVQAQQKPIYTQYILNNYIINPAISGIENYTDLKLSYRKQWVGIEGAPSTFYMSVHAPIGKKDYRTNATSFATPGENPRGRNYMEEYTAPEPHHGVGLIVMSDKTGYINRWGAYATYAYHKGLSPRTTLSAGFLAGMSSVSIDASKIDYGSPTFTSQTDDAIGYLSGSISKMRPEVGAGLWLYGADFFAGVSVLNIVPAKAKFGADSSKYGSNFAPHFFATAGYKFFLSDDISMLPSVMLQYVKPLSPQIFAGAKLQYQDKVWIGSNFRFGDQLGGFSAMAGLNISSTMNLSYAYDVAPTALNQYSRNTHEFMIGFLLGNKYDDSCPRQNW
jgi:type IX secretion system PorP/SprF family membrane protein